MNRSSVGFTIARIARPRLRRRRELDQRLQERLEAEVRQGAAEEHRRLAAGAILAGIERRAGGADQIQRLDKCAHADPSPISSRAAGSSQRRHVDRRPVLPLRLALVEQQRLALDVVDAAKRVGAADRPVHRRGRDAERALEIVEQLHRIARRVIELVDEREDRQTVALRHLEQLARLILDALRRVDHHHHAVGGDQRAIGVLAEILVARRVEQRHAAPLELELERGGRHRDAALLLERHPVGRGVPAGLAAAHGAGQLDRAGVQQQLLRQRRLAGVGMRDDRERPPSRDLALELPLSCGFRGCRRRDLVWWFRWSGLGSSGHLLTVPQDDVLLQTPPLAQRAAHGTHVPVLAAISISHLLNDAIQSLIPAIYPILKSSFQLTFTQIGLSPACSCSRSRRA